MLLGVVVAVLCCLLFLLVVVMLVVGVSYECCAWVLLSFDGGVVVTVCW